MQGSVCRDQESGLGFPQKQIHFAQCLKCCFFLPGAKAFLGQLPQLSSLRFLITPCSFRFTHLPSAQIGG